jgi:hypothetical protein
MPIAGRALSLLCSLSATALVLGAQAPTFEQIGGHVRQGLDALGRADTAHLGRFRGGRIFPWDSLDPVLVLMAELR